MTRLKIRSVSVTAEVDLSEIDDDDLLEEVDRRFLGERFPSRALRDIDHLAELIAEGRTREALDQLRSICPSVQHAGALLTFAAVRKASGATR
jgi:hypothetical protein